MRIAKCYSIRKGSRQKILRYAPCALRFREAMKEKKGDEFEEAKELFKQGLKKILQAAKNVSEKVVEGFREGYAKDVNGEKDP